MRNTPPVDPDLKSVNWAANLLNVSHWTVRNMIARNELRAYRVGRSVKVDADDARALIRPINS